MKKLLSAISLGAVVFGSISGSCITSGGVISNTPPSTLSDFNNYLGTFASQAPSQLAQNCISNYLPSAQVFNLPPYFKQQPSPYVIYWASRLPSQTEWSFFADCMNKGQ